MITDVDIKKMKSIFATKEGMENGFVEIINFIGEVKEDLLTVMNKHLEELKDITRRHQMTLENHDSRITHLEYLNK